MSPWRNPVLSALILAAICSVTPAKASLVTTDNGLGVYDSSTRLVWLANADLAATIPTQTGLTFSLPLCSANFTTGSGPAGCIAPNGVMDYQTALAWVKALNDDDYAGHDTWQLPVTTAPPIAKGPSGCSAEGALGGGYGFHCTDSALSNLLYDGLNGKQRNSILPAAANVVSDFANLQPDFYWTGTPKPPDAANPGAKNAYYTFSFNTGWQGSSVGVNDYANNNIGAAFLHTMVMFSGPPNGMTPDGSRNLQPFAGGQLVYDPVENVTWLADANPGLDLHLLPLCTGNTFDGCVNSTGAMTWTTANSLLALLNAKPKFNQYLPNGVQWLLPGAGNSAGCNWTCNDDPTDQLAYFFYNEMGLTAGESIEPGITDTIGLFSNLQPYFYWTCSATTNSLTATECSDNPDPLPADQANTFSFDSGFQSTDLSGNVNNPRAARNLMFVTAYYAAPEPTALATMMSALAGLAVFRRRRSRIDRGPGVTRQSGDLR